MSVRAERAARQGERPSAWRLQARALTGAGGALAGLVLVSAALRYWAARSVPSPWFIPDEIVYGELGKTLYRDGRLEILGGPTPFYSVLYPALVGLPLTFGASGYAALKVVQAVLVSLTAVPAYLWARTLTTRSWALVAAALTLALPGLAYAGFLMTEVIFTPLVLVAAWAMARALERPTLGRQAAVLGLIALTVATRLQGIVLVPVLVLAIALKAALDRTWLRGTRPFAPALGGLAVVAGLGVAVKLAKGGSTVGSVLGAYKATTRVSYTIGGVTRFVLYHGADVLLMTAVLPVVAVALLAWEAARGREKDAAARSYVAVAVALAVGLVGQVGLFTSALTGRLAERNLLGLAPVLFVGFALWLGRGLSRPRAAMVAVSAAALALLAAMPWHRFVTEAGEPDSFSLIPLYHLRLSYPGLSTRLLVLLGAAELLLTAVLASRRYTWLVPATVGALLVGGAIETSHIVARQARLYATVVGPQTGWIDRATSEPVTYVYSGELRWTGGGTAWVSLFWNDRVHRVYDLYGARALGPLPQTRIHPALDGTLLLPDGRPTPMRTVAASTSLLFFGRPLTVEPTHGLALWRLDPPARLAGRLLGVDTAHTISRRATLTVYDCTGFLRLGLLAPGPQRVTVWRDGARYRVLRLLGGRPWRGRIPAPAGDAGARCTFAVEPQAPLHADLLEFVRA